MMNVEVSGKCVELEIVDTGTTKCLYISNAPVCDDSYDIQLIGVYDADLELVYNTLKDFLGK